MKKRIVLIILMLITFTGCFNNENKALEFKKDYEDINGTYNSDNKEYRKVSISDDNKFIEVSILDIVNKIDNKDSFYVYFGSNIDPWCRSTIEMADKVSRDNEIEKVYYVDILDAKEDESYTKLLELLDDYDEIKIPSYFYIKDGNVKRFVSGVSDLQEDAYEELSNEILSDEESIFKSFFINICDDTC